MWNGLSSTRPLRIAEWRSLIGNSGLLTSVGFEKAALEVHALAPGCERKLLQAGRLGLRRRGLRDRSAFVASVAAPGHGECDRRDRDRQDDDCS